MSKSFRQAGLRVGVLGAHAATWLTAPNLGEIVVLVEIALTAAVILTAIYGPGKLRCPPVSGQGSNRISPRKGTGNVGGTEKVQSGI